MLLDVCLQIDNLILMLVLTGKLHDSNQLENVWLNTVFLRHTLLTLLFSYLSGPNLVELTRTSAILDEVPYNLADSIGV